MRLEHKKYALMAATLWGGGAVVFGLAYMFMLSARVEACKAAREELSEKEEEYRVAVDVSLANSRVAVEERMEQLRKDVSIYVVAPEDAANLTFEIARLAKEGRILSPSVKDRDKGAKAGLKDLQLISEQEYSVKFKSEFPQFAMMLHAMESHQPVMFVKKFSISPPTGNETLNDVQMDVSVLARQRQDG